MTASEIKVFVGILVYTRRQDPMDVQDRVFGVRETESRWVYRKRTCASLASACAC